MRRSSESPAQTKGLTFTEIMVALVIVGILASIIVPAVTSYRKKAEKVVCISNLRALHTAFDSYILDINRWPQMPAEAINFDESEFFRWWIDELIPYGVGEETWLCPSDKVQAEADPEEFAGSYIPTLFDQHRFSPMRWNQPWLIERGDFHGKCPHVLMPDGSVSPSQAPWGDR